MGEDVDWAKAEYKKRRGPTAREEALIASEQVHRSRREQEQAQAQKKTRGYSKEALGKYSEHDLKKYFDLLEAQFPRMGLEQAQDEAIKCNTCYKDLAISQIIDCDDKKYNECTSPEAENHWKTIKSFHKSRDPGKFKMMEKCEKSIIRDKCVPKLKFIKKNLPQTMKTLLRAEGKLEAIQQKQLQKAFTPKQIKIAEKMREGKYDFSSKVR